MATRSRAPRLSLPLLGAALAVALLIPAATLADTTPPPTIFPFASTGASVRLSGGSVLGKIVANTAVDFTCDPFVVIDPETGAEVETTAGQVEFGLVTILQASGKTINSGEGEVPGGSALCDGTTVNHRTAAVNASVVPWKNGTAIAGARIFIASPDFSTSHYASTGAISIRLGH